MSSDGVTWNHYSTNAGYELIRPILLPFYEASGDGCDRYSPGRYPSGISHVSLTYHAGYFYLHFFYYHNKNNAVPPGVSLDDAQDQIAYRFAYDPAHTYGFSTLKQIFYNNQWVGHSGQLVWDYDQAPAAPGTNDPILSPGKSMTTLAFAGGDIKQDNATLNNFCTNGNYPWIHFYNTYPEGKPQGQINWDSTCDIASDSWTRGGIVDTSAIENYFGSANMQKPGVYFGWLNPENPLWAGLFVPVNFLHCPGGDYAALGISISGLSYW